MLLDSGVKGALKLMVGLCSFGSLELVSVYGVALLFGLCCLLCCCVLGVVVLNCGVNGWCSGAVGLVSFLVSLELLVS